MRSRVTIDLKFELPHLKQSIHIHSDHNRIGIMGPSGFGKSSIAQALVGIESRCTGEFQVMGKSFLQLPAWVRNIGYVPQDYLLLPHLSVEKNILFPRGAEAFPELWKVLGIESLLQRHPRLLSGGEKQRIAIARALGHGSKMVVMDEPFSALDKASRERIILFLDGFCKQRDIDLLVFSHDERDLIALGCQLHQLDR